MVAMRDEGLIGAVGLSNVTFEEYRAAQAITEVACVQNAYNLADRSDQALLDACAADGVAYVPLFPLGSAFHPRQASIDGTGRRRYGQPARRHNRPGGTGLAPAALSESAADPGTSSLTTFERISRQLSWNSTLEPSTPSRDRCARR
jgi:aryl-alcohol dehydrogenase-like predicted oxidoreductase